MPLRAGNLGRVSKDKSGRVRSVTEQHDENRIEIDANGWLEAIRYEDEGSASRFAKQARPDWTRLVEDVEADRLDVVVMWDVSRGSRELEDWAGFLRRCREHTVLIHVTTNHHSYDMRVGQDWKDLADAGVDSAFESEKKSRDARRGIAANKKDGLPHGICKYGYERIHDEKTGALLGQRPIPEQAQVCAEIIRRAAHAEPISVIAEDLMARNIPAPSGGKWYRRQVSRIATSVAYIGKIRLDGELIDAKWPAITDEVTFWAAQHLLTSPERKTTRPGKAKYLLSYIMTCGACGSSVCAEPPRNRRKTAIYTCPKSHASVAMSEADQWVTGVVLARLAEPDLYEHLTAGSDEQVMRARAEAAKLRAELDEWAAADISAHAYSIREAKLLPLIEAAEKRAIDLSIPLALRDLASARDDIDARWDKMVIAARRDVVRALFESLTLIPAQNGHRPPVDERITLVWAGQEAGKNQS